MVMQSTAAGLPQNSGGKGAKRSFSVAFEPWLYLSPGLVLLLLVLVVPLIFGVSYSFRKFSAFKSEYVGLAQYQALLHDQVLGQALMNTLWWTVASLVLQFFSASGWHCSLTGILPAKNSSRQLSFCHGRCRRSCRA